MFTAVPRQCRGKGIGSYRAIVAKGYVKNNRVAASYAE
jgi:hypothetical protein